MGSANTDRWVFSYRVARALELTRSIDDHGQTALSARCTDHGVLPALLLRRAWTFGTLPASLLRRARTSGALPASLLRRTRTRGALSRHFYVVHGPAGRSRVTFTPYSDLRGCSRVTFTPYSDLRGCSRVTFTPYTDLRGALASLLRRTRTCGVLSRRFYAVHGSAERLGVKFSSSTESIQSSPAARSQILEERCLHLDVVTGPHRVIGTCTAYLHLLATFLVEEIGGAPRVTKLTISVDP